MTRPTASDALIADLAALYGWPTPTPGTRLTLARAFAGFTRIDIAGVASSLNRTAPPVTPTKLAEALRAAARAHRTPNPPATDTAAVPTHPPDCMCEGTGVLVEDGLALVDKDTGEALSRRRFRTSRDCPGNGGQRMTREQWARLQAEQRTAGRPPATFRASLAEARAHLHQLDTPGDEHDPTPPAA